MGLLRQSLARVGKDLIYIRGAKNKLIVTVRKNRENP